MLASTRVLCIPVPYYDQSNVCHPRTQYKVHPEQIPKDPDQGHAVGRETEERQTMACGVRAGAVINLFLLYLTPRAETLACQHGGRWNGKVCTCRPGWVGMQCETQVTCNFPGAPRNGRVQTLLSAYPYDTLVSFECNEGYSLQGAELAKCLDGGRWSAAPPKCKLITCGQLPQPANGQLLPQQATYGHGAKVHYLCNTGYRLRGPQTRTCGRNGNSPRGKWDGFHSACSPVDCGDPGLPINGARQGTNFKYGGLVTFSCVAGSRLEGSSGMHCQANGKWLGTTPRCIQIRCEAPPVPAQGSVRFSRKPMVMRTLARFTCDVGHVLHGPQVLKCQQDGTWNGSEPVCRAVVCGDPGAPRDGAKDGLIYTFPHSVTYHCFAGYVLRGHQRISCQADGWWSASKPVCQACPQGTYKENKDRQGVCLSCPLFTKTLADASPSISHCLCKTGYQGPPGGPCQEIKCAELPSPENGKTECRGKAKIGTTCSFSCNDGYIFSRGSSTRSCQKNGEWDGSWPHCSPCPINSYKNDERSCLPCPRHSHTTAPAKMKGGCLCDEGFAGPGGGPCNDMNECLPNGGKGPCEDICENTEGGYKCRCSIPGYRLSHDGHTCYAHEQCRNLTAADVPANGGLVCFWFHRQNSQRCDVQCNPGFQIPQRGTSYVICDSSTGYNWSFKLRSDADKINPCEAESCGDPGSPTNGVKIGSTHRLYSSVRFECLPGSYMTGSRYIRCQPNGKWYPSKPTCTVCAKNTYKNGSNAETSCTACPANTHTVGLGSTEVTQCVCDEGLQGPPGGPCTVALGNQCSAFPEPQHGKAVCSNIAVTNTKLCQLICDAGYDLLDRPAVFEQCGPGTGWKWIFELMGYEIPPCVEEHLPDVSNDLEQLYLMHSCPETSPERRQFQTAYISMLKAQGVCKQGSKEVCKIDSVTIQCGHKAEFGVDTDIRLGNSTSQTPQRVMQFKSRIHVPGVSLKSANCAPYCQGATIASNPCKELCRNAIQIDSVRKVNAASAKLKAVYQTSVKVNSQGTHNIVTAPDNLLLTVGPKTAFPASANVKLSPMLTKCESGTVPKNSGAKCVACPAGRFAHGNQCLLCPIGQHQPRDLQTRCLPCPPGSTTLSPGARNCLKIQL